MRFVPMTLLAFGALACAAPSSDQATEAARGPELPFYLGGIQVNEADQDAWFDALLDESMNTVHVTDYARQGDWDGDHLWWLEENPEVLEEIRGAKKRGLSVVLVLRVALDPSFERNAFLWHGMIQPKSDALLASWFEKYGRFCRRWAEIAEREGVDALFLGSELNALTSTVPLETLPMLEQYYLDEEKQAQRREEVLAQRELIENKKLTRDDDHRFDSVEEYVEARIASEQSWARGQAEGASPEERLEALNARRARLQDHWLGLIEDLRNVYTGPLGYGGNFDQYREVGFWSALDVMGLSAYFQLRRRVLPGFDAERLYPLLEQGWRQVLGEIAEFRNSQGLGDQPVLFTEMGYTWRRNSTLEPWSDTGFSVFEEEGKKQVVVWQDEPRQLEERALAVRALYAAHRDVPEPFLRGILYWKLSSLDYLEKEEAFMVKIGGPSSDPVLPELRRFLE